MGSGVLGISALSKAVIRAKIRVFDFIGSV
jgi:hypothetical protein